MLEQLIVELTNNIFSEFHTNFEKLEMISASELLIFIVQFILFSFVYMFIRNQWVFSVRIKLIDEDHSTYKKLESYDTMMIRFWIWNVKKFIRD